MPKYNVLMFSWLIQIKSAVRKVHGVLKNDVSKNKDGINVQ